LKGTAQKPLGTATGILCIMNEADRFINAMQPGH
jgi:hypothetical protein